MRFEFQPLPLPRGGYSEPRPTVDLYLEGLESTALRCLVDTGAAAVRLDRELAELAGIDLGAAEEGWVAVGGTTVKGLRVSAGLRIETDHGEHAWEAPIWFCSPWDHGFGLLGLDGFLRQFRVTVSAYWETLDLQPESQLEPPWPGAEKGPTG